MSDNSFKNVTVQLPADLLVKIDAEADKLDLNRSQYFRRLLRKELQPISDAVSHVEQSPAPAAPAAQPMERAA